MPLTRLGQRYSLIFSRVSESLFDLNRDPLELNDLAKDPNMKEELDQLRSVHDHWMRKVMDVGLIPEAIMRNWEHKYDQSIYYWVRTQEDFYDELLLMSSTSDENTLLEGLNHPNEAVRYWAGQGFYNLEKKIRNRSLDRLKQKLDDPIVNVRISVARALLMHQSSSKKIIKILSDGLNAENEWTRLQTALVLDDFLEVLKELESKANNLIRTDSNKYVVRVLNHAINDMNGTSNKVR